MKIYHIKPKQYTTDEINRLLGMIYFDDDEDGRVWRNDTVFIMADDRVYQIRESGRVFTQTKRWDLFKSFIRDNNIKDSEGGFYMKFSSQEAAIAYVRAIESRLGMLIL